jgi:enoyl-CoA hydratase
MGEIPPHQHGQDYRATTLRLEWPRRHVALVTLTRPEERNAISVETIHELGEALSVAHRQRAGALVITGAGRSFCAGANLKTLASPDSPFFRDPMMFRDKFLAPLAQVLDRFEEMPFPIIAAISGHAVGGGCELALSADLRIMSFDAILALPEVQLGATPGAGGVQKLIRHVGRSRALEWILLGARVTAQQAMAAGLLVEVTDVTALIDRALAVAERVASFGPRAIAQAKASIYLAEDADLRTARRFGVEALTALASTEEWREGVSAFVQKRPPRFR